MSKNQTQVETGGLFAASSSFGNRAAKSSARPRVAAALTLAAAVALTTGGGPSALAEGSSFKLLYSFCSLSGCLDGAQPYGGLVADKAGNVYGTTFGAGPDGEGTVFELAPNGILTTLHAFDFNNNANDGAFPYAGVILDKAGNLYGTTYGGGAGNRGIVFKLAPDGTETVLHGFTGGSDGALPIGTLLERKGDFYGTTYVGGPSNNGTVFKVTSDGTETVLHAFGGGTDGELPFGELIADNAGNLYGTTYGGGADSFGIVFKVAPNDKEKVLYAFKGGNDGAYPVGGVILDKAGNLYGTTDEGGANVGTVFELAPDSTETVLYSFMGGNDGAYPYAGLMADSAGNFFGTTTGGGGSDACSAGCGTIFKLAPDGTETVLDSLYGINGELPFFGALTTDGADRKGAVFGTTTLGDRYDEGGIFSIKE